MKTFETILVGDFETTVYDGQERTDVWASALVHLYSENVKILHSIEETWKYILSIKGNILIYYHNLKFDGSFWLDYFLKALKYRQAYYTDKDNNIKPVNDKYMKSKTFKYSISEMGQWYYIRIKMGNRYIEIRDSYKLLPYSVERIGKSFGTKHKKLEMEYKGFRFPGCEITEEEKRYIANDVLVVKEALEIMYQSGHNKLTIGACCLAEFKKIIKSGVYDFKEIFPDLTNYELPEKYGCKTAEEYVRKSYRGGWCYVKDDCINKVLHKGITADVNSLYPSVMHSDSGNYYPVGSPNFFENEIPDIAKNYYYFVTFTCYFELKEGYLPFIQIKNNLMYKGNEMLKTSDFNLNGKYVRSINVDNEEIDSKVTLTLTCTDFDLFLEHYNVYDLEILHGCWFYTEIGLFDDYINHYKQQKMNSKGAKREEAKFFLNNLYGKMATSNDSSFKIFKVVDNQLKFQLVNEHNKKVVYIPIGSAITSYARNFTIRAAQRNYNHFIYADTDSIHCNCSVSDLKGVPIHESEFNHWKIESYWDIGWFTRQKTYIEHITHEDGKEINPYYNIKCAGMNNRCKELLNASLEGKEIETNTKEEKDFLYDGDKIIKRDVSCFQPGLIVPGKLMATRIDGGLLLKVKPYEMR